MIGLAPGYFYASLSHLSLALIRLEAQAAVRRGSGRIHIYHYRILDRYDCEVVSLVLAMGGSKRYRPEGYEFRRWGCELVFRFPVVKLVDYEVGRVGRLAQSVCRWTLPGRQTSNAG